MIPHQLRVQPKQSVNDNHCHGNRIGINHACAAVIVRLRVGQHRIQIFGVFWHQGERSGATCGQLAIELRILKIEEYWSTSRAVPHKRCSLPKSSWLGNFEHIPSSLEIWAVWGTPFPYFFVMCRDNSYFEIDSTCLHLSNKLFYFAINDRQLSYIQHF